jgi:hypothetical protein
MQPRVFRVERDTDINEASGTGHVADGIVWPDRTVTMRWRGERPSTVHWDDLADAIEIHGHNGATRFVFDDEIENAASPTEFTQRGFAVYSRITDDRGGTLRIQESSAADDSYVWLFAESRHDTEPGHSSIHLNADNACELRDALNGFLKEYSA